MDRADVLRLAPEPLDLRGGAGVILDDEPTLYLVETGSIALFLAEYQGGAQVTPRRLVARFGVGQSIVSAQTTNRDGLRFVIDAIGEGSVRAIALADVLVNGPQDRDVARLVNQWLGRVSHVFSALAGPAIPIRATTGTVELGPDESLRPTSGKMIWCTVAAGTVRLLGDEALLLDAAAGPFPLGHRMWIEAHDGPARALLVRAREVQDPAAIVGGLTRMSDVVRDHFRRKIDVEGRAELDRLRERGRLRRAQMERARSGLIDALEGGTPEAHDDDALLAAVRTIGATLGVEVRPAAPSEDPRRVADPFDAIARASHLRSRKVALSEDWWRRDCGNLLAYVGESDAGPRRPVALLRSGRLAYQVFDPATGGRAKLDRETERGLEREAVMIYRPFPYGELGLSDLFRFALGRRYRDVTWILLAGLAATLLGMVTPLAMAALMDRAIPDADQQLVLALGGALLAAAFGRTLFALSQSIVLARVGALSQAATQAALWDRLLRLRPSFFRGFASGDLQSRLSAVAEIIRELNGTAIRSLVGGTLALANLGLLLYYSPGLALIAVVVTVIGLAFVMSMSAAIRRHVRRLAELEGVFFGTVVQIVGAVTKLKVAGAQDRAYVHWMRRYAEQLRLRAAAQRIEDFVGVFNQAVPTASQAVVFYFAYVLLIDGRAPGADGMSLGAFLAFNAAYGTFVAGATELSNTFVGLLDTAIKARRVLPILQAEPEVGPSKVDPGRLSGRLALQRASFRYREKGPMVLDQVTIRAEPGEFVALVGPSGSGKSTALRLLLGFDELESGAVTYDGQDLSGLDVGAVRRQLGVVMQSGKLNTASIYENIAGGNVLSLDEAWEAAEQAGLADEIRAMPMEMHTIVSEGGSNLSGGQRQRLLIARALALRPRVLYFDEATSSLDNRTQAIVAESLDRLRVTRVVIAHRLSTIRRADRIYVLDGGKVVEEGGFRELMDRGGLFARMMARQVA